VAEQEVSVIIPAFAKYLLPFMDNITEFLADLPHTPGVYQMFDASNTILYVGKAKNLAHRLKSYFQKTGLSVKTTKLVSLIHHIETMVTHTETEALLLEQSLIKKHHPKYNILLRDDKSYPYVVLSHHEFPRLSRYRGTLQSRDNYFGPYPNTSAVYESLDFLSRSFKLRTCSDTFFKHRSRPCLQYHIKRCDAPCVGLISSEAYQQKVKEASLFLKGKSKALMANLEKQMIDASDNLQYERALEYREQITRLKTIREKQSVLLSQGGNYDVFGVASQEQYTVVSLLGIREGQLISSRHFFAGTAEGDVLSSVMSHYYTEATDFSDKILMATLPEEQEWLEKFIAEKKGSAVTFSTHKKYGDYIRLAEENALSVLTQKLKKVMTSTHRFENLQKTLQLKTPIAEIICVDISHLQGKSTVGAVVVFNSKGADHKAYRRFTLGDFNADDPRAIAETLRRFFLQRSESGQFPDIVIIDGGPLQCKAASEVLPEGMILFGIVKGQDRNPLYDRILYGEKALEMPLDTHSLSRHLIQEMRDAVHHYAITGHRKKREKAVMTSPLESIEGIGEKRRKRLLQHFGGHQGLMKASAEEIAKVSGVGVRLAQKIYDILHT
jgi:excinuclease ABC subunit C